MPFWGQLILQEGATPIIRELIKFHDHAMLILIIVLTIVGYAIVALIRNSLTARDILEAQLVETVWTIIPAVVLFFLALPSLRLLYLMDEVGRPTLTLKSIGHQWYWSYEYTDLPDLKFDSYIIPDAELEKGIHRLLEVDNRVVLPIKTNIRGLITRGDVIHSWAIPALGVKVDAIPGRLNQVGIFAMQSGIYYGQCSEICGANHRFIPIVLEFIRQLAFSAWLDLNGEVPETQSSMITPNSQHIYVGSKIINWIKSWRSIFGL